MWVGGGWCVEAFTVALQGDGEKMSLTVVVVRLSSSTGPLSSWCMRLGFIQCGSCY